MNKNNNKVLLVICIILGLFFILLVTGVIKINSNEFNSTNNREVKEKDEVLNLIGLTENGYKRMSDELKEQYQLNGDNYIDYNYYDIAKVFTDLNPGEYKVGDIGSELLNRLFFNYAVSNSIELIGIDSNGDQNHPCYEGVGSCFGITDESYKIIANAYDLSENPEDLLQKYDGLYLIKNFATIDNPHEINDSLSINYNKNDIIVNYNIELKPTQDYNSNGSTFNKIITYTFKMNMDNKYYLSNIKVEDK